MLRSLTMFVLAAAVGTPALAAQEAQEILATAQARQAERWSTVDNYRVVQSIGGVEVTQYYQKFEVDGQAAFRLVPVTEYVQAEDGQQLSAEELRTIAAAEESTAAELKKKRGEGGAQMPDGMNADELLTNHAMLLNAAATAHEEAEASEGGRVDATAGVRAMTAFGRRAQVVGTEQVNGRDAFLLRAEGLSDIDLSEPGAEAQFTMNTMSVWIDSEHYVLLRTKMDGDLAAEGKVRPMTVERVTEDYRPVGPLYEPYRQVMRITGLMDALSDKDRKKLEEGRKQMAEAEEQMAEMDAATRSMVEGQMEKARQMLASLEASGAIETTVDVVRIEINQGPPQSMGN
jgi:outer membrane lipoprotein-sorting protein